MLGRPATQPDLDYWTGQLANGYSVADIRQVLSKTQDAADAIQSLFQGVLGRPATQSDITCWEGQLQQGVSLGDIRQVFSKTPDAQAHINALYQQAHGRPATSGEMATAQQILGTMRSDGQGLSFTATANGVPMTVTSNAAGATIRGTNPDTGAPFSMSANTDGPRFSFTMDGAQGPGSQAAGQKDPGYQSSLQSLSTVVGGAVAIVGGLMKALGKSAIGEIGGPLTIAAGAGITLMSTNEGQKALHDLGKLLEQYPSTGAERYVMNWDTTTPLSINPFDGTINDNPGPPGLAPAQNPSPISVSSPENTDNPFSPATSPSQNTPSASSPGESHGGVGYGPSSASSANDAAGGGMLGHV